MLYWVENYKTGYEYGSYEGNDMDTALFKALTDHNMSFDEDDIESDFNHVIVTPDLETVVDELYNGNLISYEDIDALREDDFRNRILPIAYDNGQGYVLRDTEIVENFL